MSAFQSLLMDWSIDKFLNNLNNSLFSWGKVIVVIIGVVMVVVGIFLIAKGLMAQGRSQTNWVLAIALMILGGALAFGGGWSVLEDFGKGSKNTLDNLGKDVIFVEAEAPAYESIPVIDFE